MRSQALIKPYFKYIFNFFEKILILSLFFDLHKIFADLHKVINQMLITLLKMLITS